MTFVHFITWPLGCVILNAVKNLSERPFVSLRVTTLLCPSFVVRFRLLVFVAKVIPVLVGVRDWLFKNLQQRLPEFVHGAQQARGVVPSW